MGHAQITVMEVATDFHRDFLTYSKNIVAYFDWIVNIFGARVQTAVFQGNVPEKSFLKHPKRCFLGTFSQFLVLCTRDR